MRQRAALLRSYLFSREFMLLDEPFSALDAFTKADMHEWCIQSSPNRQNDLSKIDTPLTRIG